MLALSAGLLLSALLAREHGRLLTQQHNDTLDRVSERVLEKVRGELEKCALLLRAVQSLFHASDEVDAAEFELMYHSLSPRAVFPALRALAFSRPVVVAGEVQFVTTLFAPFAGNEPLADLDVRSQPFNLDALQRSRDSNQPAMSTSFRLAQSPPVGPGLNGFVLRLPYYQGGDIPQDLAGRRARFAGSVAASFTLGKLLDAALWREVQLFDVRVVDITDPDAPQLLHGSTEPATDGPDRPAALRSHTLDFGGRSWRIDLAGGEQLEGVDPIPQVTFVIGALASVLLALLLMALTRARGSAEQLAAVSSRRFQDSELRFHSLNDLLPAAVLLARRQGGHLTYVNPAARQLLGIHPGDTGTGRLQEIFNDGELRSRLLQEEDLELDNLATRILHRRDGAFWASVWLRSIVHEGLPHSLVVILDTSELRELNDRLRHQSSHDSLTDLLNRFQFELHLERAVAEATGTGSSGALLYLDLDQFRLINDTSGHGVGDRLINTVSRLIRDCLQQDDVLARLGGDEFGILLPACDRHRALAVAEQIRMQVSEHREHEAGREHSLTVSTGVVILEAGRSSSAREALALADTACYMAKEHGRNRIHLASPDDIYTLTRRSEMDWIGRLRQALAEDRFELHFQRIEPLHERAGGAHFELLLRLRDEHGELVPPGEFIPAAERFHLMPQIDRWVVAHALRVINGHPLMQDPESLCAINLSANTLEDVQFPDFVMMQLRQHGVAANRLCFEITETAAVTHMQRALRLIERLRGMGCRFALDDFGAGMSSFGYLKNLPIDFVKIDGSFIRDIENDRMSYAIVRAVSDICHQVGVGVIAEFVETAAIRDLLLGLGVDHAQGYGVHRPEPLLRAS